MGVKWYNVRVTLSPHENSFAGGKDWCAALTLIGGANVAQEHIPSTQEHSAGQRPRKKRRKRSGLRQVFTVVGTLFLVFAITCSFLACFAAVYIKNVIMPNTDMDIAEFPMNLSSSIYYIDPETGAEVEYETLHGDQNRVRVRYEDIPQDLIHAAVALEDRRFYKHNGVDWLSTAKGVLSFFTGGRVRGGSTITQQLIKNVTERDDVTVKRKVLEIFTALEFDKKYSKETTLEWYLNYVYFGRKCYGVYTASYMYFGKDVSQLSLAECASLISITNNPSMYDPYTNPENNHARRNVCLDWMLAEGYISQEECEAAKAEEIDFHQSQSDNAQSTYYSWYTEQVITDVVNDLMEEHGYSQKVAEDIVYSGGLKIYACVDPKVQSAVEKIYSNTENLPYTSPSGQQLQSAIVVVDSLGNVAGLAGKMGEKTAEDTRGYNMASRAQRQPGSSIKPLSVYSPALEMGLITPYSVFEDSPDRVEGDRPWPSNVNNRYTGQMTVFDAVVNSTNTVAVRTMTEVTPEVGFEYLLEKYHIDPDHLVISKEINGKYFTDIGPSQLALGGLTNGVTTLDMAGAYSVFPRNGVYIEPRTYSRVVDSNNKELLSKGTEGEPVLKEKTVYYLNEMLKGVVKSGSGSAAALSNMTVAGKTGSTTANNDRWFVGYTPYYTAAVWVGYSRPERVRVSGSNPAAVLWNKVMSQVHAGLDYKDFPRPDGLVAVEYCLDTGLIATDECRSDMRGSRAATGYLFPEDVPTARCEAHTMVEVCTLDPVLNDEGKPTGRYHLAGEFCTETVRDEATGEEKPCKISVAVLDMPREYVGNVHPEDDAYFLASLEALGPCTVHTEAAPVDPNPYDPYYFDITNPSTWPTAEEDPNFDPSDPTTWPYATEPLPTNSHNPAGPTESRVPIYVPPTVPPAQTHTPVTSEPPTVRTDPPAPVHTPEPTTEPTPGVVLPPIADPVLPPGV